MIFYVISLSSLRDVACKLAFEVHTPGEANGFNDGNRGGFSDPVLDHIIAAAIIRTDAGREAALRAASIAAGATLPRSRLWQQPPRSW